MLPEMFNIVGFHIPKEMSTSHNLQSLDTITKHHDNIIYSSLRSNEGDENIDRMLDDFQKNECNFKEMSEQLLPSEVRTILRSEDELSQILDKNLSSIQQSTSSTVRIFSLLFRLAPGSFGGEVWNWLEEKRARTRIAEKPLSGKVLLEST
jgi:hypothetical protein